MPPGKILRYARFKDLIALGRKGATTWAYQTDLRRNVRFVRTVRVTLGKQGEMGLKGARIAAAKAQEQIRAGVDPNWDLPMTPPLGIAEAICAGQRARSSSRSEPVVVRRS